jgi:hypothetical protein
MVVLSLFFCEMDLPADLAARIGRVRGCRQGYSMDIGIGRIRFERVHQCVEVAGLNILCRDRLDVGLCPRAGDGSTVLGASLWSRSRPGKREVRAEENDDAPGIARLAKVDVGLGHRARLRWRGADVRVGQFVVDGASRFIEIELYRPLAVGQDRTGVALGIGGTVRDRPDFVDPFQVGGELLRAGVARHEADNGGGKYRLEML